MPRLTTDQLREPLIEGAFKAVRNQGHQTVSRKSLFTGPAHRRVFRQMLDDLVADPETEEVGRAAAALLRELVPDRDDKRRTPRRLLLGACRRCAGGATPVARTVATGGMLLRAGERAGSVSTRLPPGVIGQPCQRNMDFDRRGLPARVRNPAAEWPADGGGAEWRSPRPDAPPGDRGLKVSVFPRGQPPRGA